MKQVILQDGHAVVVDVPAPLTPRGGVLVQVGYSVISTGTELANLRGTAESVLAKARRRPELALQAMQAALQDGLTVTVERIQSRLRRPVATGYACAGTVVEVGADVADLRVGQAVACAGAESAWHAEYVAVPRLLVCPLPDGVALRSAASAAVGAIALQGVRQASVELGDVVVVMGLGLIGLLTVQLARAAGARVVAADPLPERRALAERLGAWAAVAPGDAGRAIHELTRGLGADRTIITAATQSHGPVRQAMQLTRKRGIVVVVGDVGLHLARSPFYQKEIELRIACSYGPGRYDGSYEQEGRDYPPAYVRWTENRNLESYLELVQRGAVDWDAVAPREFPVEDAAEAFALLERPDHPPGVMLRYAVPSTPEPPRVRSEAVRRPVPPVQGVVRLGIIGAGAFARAVHLPHLKRLRDKFSLVGIATRTGIHARSAAREAGAAFYTTDYRELLARSDVDAVLIATRHDQHAALAVAALEAGKAVFLEKPLAITRAQLDEVLASVEAARLPFLVGFNRRFSAAYRFLAERLRGAAGPALIIYRVNADPGATGDWSQGDEGGGRAVGEACHMVDFFHALARGTLEQLQVLGHGAAGDRPDANFSAQLRFTDGTLATLIYTTRGQRRLPKERVEVFLGDTVAIVEDFRRGIVYRPGGLFLHRERVNKGLREEWDAFHAACVGGDPLPIPLETLRSVTEATFRIREEATR